MQRTIAGRPGHYREATLTWTLNPTRTGAEAVYGKFSLALRREFDGYALHLSSEGVPLGTSGGFGLSLDEALFTATESLLESRLGHLMHVDRQIEQVAEALLFTYSPTALREGYELLASYASDAAHLANDVDPSLARARRSDHRSFLADARHVVGEEV